MIKCVLAHFKRDNEQRNNVIKRKMLKYLLLGLAVFLSGCVTTMGGEEVARLQYGLGRLNKQTNEALEKIEKKEESLENKLAVLEDEVKELKNEIDVNRQALIKIEPGVVSAQGWLLPQEKESQLFQTAYSDYLKGQYSLAVMGLQEYLRLNPQGSRAAEAEYWLAESFFSQKDFKSAVEEFDKLIKNHPKSRWAAPGLYKKALALAKDGKDADALVIAEEIITKFPKSDESRLAEELKKELEPQIPKP